jgi:eukaryotic-like serine/threonine-protein kinase
MDGTGRGHLSPGEAPVPGGAADVSGTPVSRTLTGVELQGRYRLERELGRGAVSSVYRAHDIVLDRTVAIKFLQRQRTGDANQLERFRREARAMATLVHPQIVTVIDAGDADLGDAWGAAAESGGTPYIIFEHVEGETLKQRIRRDGPLHVQQAIAHAIEIGQGLQAAHEHGIVHRDVKPQNVLLSVDGGAKIADFGIARTLSEQGLTMEGRVLGTTDYVAPEQALGQQATAQSDVYSLGVVLYEMLTGAVPFTAPTPVGVAMRHVREQLPDVQALRPGLSDASASLVERATAKDLERRYASALAMVRELDQALAIETSLRRRHRHGRWLAMRPRRSRR